MTNDGNQVFFPQMNFNNLVENNSAYSALLNASKNNWRVTPRNLLDVSVSQRKSRGTKIVSWTTCLTFYSTGYFIWLDN